MEKKIVYVVGGLYAVTGMVVILSQKINYLSEHTNFKLYMILTESPNKPWVFKMNPNIKWVNFNINFDELDSMPFWKKIPSYIIKQYKYKKAFTKYLMDIRPDITVSALRRDINFLNGIKDGSKKIGEIHFGRKYYREFHFQFLPTIVNSMLTNIWMRGLIKNLKRLDKFVVLTNSDYNNWPELDNIIVIPNFINSFPLQKSPLKEKNVIAIGRYTWQKGFDLLIDAWSIVNSTHKEWKLHIYGPGDNLKYQEIANKKGLGNNVICHGYAKDVYEEYRKSSIFVLSSRYEGFGLVLVEAMASGLPAVAFSCPEGPADIITQNVDGFLVESGNIHELAQGLIHLMDNEITRKEFGDNARNNMSRFNKDTIMQQWIDLFNSL